MAWDEIPDWAQAVSQTLLRALKERDPYTFGHCVRVGRLGRLLAQTAGLSPLDQRIVELASLFHDIGKIGVPDTVLMKPGRLTEEEEAIMREHPIKSAEILEPLSHLPLFRATLPGILHHHERVDGAGYPDGIRGDDIPLTSRIILVVDTYDAMTTTRPYRKSLSDDIAYKELEKYSGRQFDPELARIFIEAHPSWGKEEQEQTEQQTLSGWIRRAA